MSTVRAIAPPSVAAPSRPPRALYPPQPPFNSGFLEEQDGHCVAFEEVGNPHGQPAIFFHGGPGAGCCSAGDGGAPKVSGFFDLSVYRVVLMDQRGSGRSTPSVAASLAGLEANTTWHLVEDAERLRAKLGIEKWLVFGGSWGSTLAMAYAQRHASRVTALVLRGIFTLRHAELAWFYQEGASFIFPDAWAAYLAPIPQEERGDLIAAYARRLGSSDEAVVAEAAKAWSIWEGATSKLIPDEGFTATYGADAWAIAFARIENLYFVNKGWFSPDDQLLRDVHLIKHIPCVIVQGRYDLVCPIFTANALHEAWPEAEYHVIPDAGHSAWEPGIQSALLDATDKFRGGVA